jgi:nitrate reductase delta subunit
MSLLRRRNLLGPVLDPAHRRVAFAAGSVLLRYPDEGLVEDLALIISATGDLPKALRQPFGELAEHLSTKQLLDSQAQYVATFDLKRRCCLYLSYYLSGDTRRRGMALWQFQEAYRLAGFQVLRGELPDYLPVLLELAASGAEGAAIELMERHRAGIRVLLAALDELSSPYAGVVRAVDSLLATPISGAIANALLLAHKGPPTELVGIEPREAFDPYGRHEPCTACAPLGSPGAGIGHEARQESS